MYNLQHFYLSILIFRWIKPNLCNYILNDTLKYLTLSIQMWRNLIIDVNTCPTSCSDDKNCNMRHVAWYMNVLLVWHHHHTFEQNDIHIRVIFYIKYNVWYTLVQNCCKNMRRRRCIIKHYTKYLQTKEGNHSLVEGFFWLMNTLTAYHVRVVRAADICWVLYTSWLHQIPTNNGQNALPRDTLHPRFNYILYHIWSKNLSFELSCSKDRSKVLN